MACNGAYATAQEFADFWGITDVCPESRDAIEGVLDIAVSDIHVILASVGACDCSLGGWANTYLKKLNIIDAIAYYIKICGQPSMITDAMRDTYLTWMERQLMRIADGTVDLCDGETGSKFPAMGWAAQSVTDFAAADIIIQDIMKNSGG